MLSLFYPNPTRHWLTKKVNSTQIELYKSQLDVISDSEYDLFISGEDLSLGGFMFLDRMTTYFKGKGFQIIPILCVRSPYSFFCSILSHRVKHSHYLSLIGLEPFIKPNPGQKEKTDFGVSTISRMMNYFGDNLHLIDFNLMKKHNKKAFGYFLENVLHISSDFLPVEDLSLANKSLTNYQTRFQNRYNLLKSKNICSVPISNSVLDEKRKLLTDTKFLLTQNEFSFIEADYHSALNTLNELGLDDQANEEIIFSEFIPPSIICNALLGLYDEYNYPIKTQLYS